MTATDFLRNYLGNEGWVPQRRPSSVPIDTAEMAAERILSAALEEPAEQYMAEQSED